VPSGFGNTPSDWFNNRRLLEPIGNIPPAEAEANYYAAQEPTAMAA
jgi:transposase InsO family protein